MENIFRFSNIYGIFRENFKYASAVQHAVKTMERGVYMKSSTAYGLMLFSALLALAMGAAFAEENVAENATANNTTENVTENATLENATLENVTAENVTEENVTAEDEEEEE